MLCRSTIWALAPKVAPLAVALAMTAGAVAAGDDIKYPDWKGQWRGVLRVGTFAGQPSFDPTKPWGKGQQAPLTPEYQAVLEANLKSQEQGSFFDWRGATCLGFGMPLIAYGFQPIEFIVTPETTYMLIDWVEHTRRIYTDGRDWPKEIEPTLVGYSIGKWLDEDHDGRYDVLEVETRGFKGPRHYEATGIPLHQDNQSVITERLFIDRADADTLHDVITVNDHALTHPWTVDKHYKRDHNPIWYQNDCSEDNRHVFIGNEHYVIGYDDKLMPAKKDQAPPDLSYFKP